VLHDLLTQFPVRPVCQPRPGVFLEVVVVRWHELNALRDARNESLPEGFQVTRFGLVHQRSESLEKAQPLHRAVCGIQNPDAARHQNPPCTLIRGRTSMMNARSVSVLDTSACPTSRLRITSSNPRTALPYLTSSGR